MKCLSWNLVACLVFVGLWGCAGWVHGQTTQAERSETSPRAKIRFAPPPPPKKTKRVFLVPFSDMTNKTIPKNAASGANPTAVPRPTPKPAAKKVPESRGVEPSKKTKRVYLVPFSQMTNKAIPNAPVPEPEGMESSELRDEPQVPTIPELSAPPKIVPIPNNTDPQPTQFLPGHPETTENIGTFHQLPSTPPPPLPALPHPRKKSPLAISESVPQPIVDKDLVLLDLPGVLELVKGKNLRVILAEERIQEAYARHKAAKVLWLPTVNVGMSYNKHEGTLQASDGQILEVSRSSLQSGAGVFAVGAGTVMRPGLSAQFHLKDAWFEPKIAQERLFADQMTAAADAKDVMRDVALTYLDLWTAHQSKAIAIQTLHVTRRLAQLTEKFAKAGQGPQSDADRSLAELAVRNNAIWQAEEEVQVTTARLCELLRIDVSSPIGIKESNMFPLDLIPPDQQVGDLIAQALTNRPELAASRHLVEAACQRVNQEKCSPWLPSVVLAASYGGFGGSPSSAINNFNDRFDLDAGVFWQVRNLGFGESASRKAANSRLEQAKITEMQLMDRIAREVVEQHRRVELRQKQIEMSRNGLLAAVQSLQHNWDRIKEGEGLPIEVLQSIQALNLAQREYLRTVSSYNRAQLELQWVLGWTE